MLFCGVSAGIRTQDPILKRDVLYLLSYWDILSLLRPQKYTFFHFQNFHKARFFTKIIKLLNYNKIHLILCFYDNDVFY